jgi:SAM-dependent methyltransferase
VKKNLPEHYGEAYWMHPMAAGPGDTASRGIDNGNFTNCAMTAKRLLEKELPAPDNPYHVVEVGCGIGFVVRHLRNLGLQADGIEYGTWSVEHSACGAKWGDITEKLPAADASADLVICVGVLSHIPEEMILQSLKELRRISRRFVWTNIQLYWHPDQNHHKTFEQPTWWRRRFAEAGLKERPDLWPFLLESGYGQAPTQWPAIWEVA